MPGPLTGLRVLDIATIIAAPTCAPLLADYGAEVVKAEVPERGDGARDFPPFKDGKSLWWKAINRNKKFITLDLRKPDGVAHAQWLSDGRCDWWPVRCGRRTGRAVSAHPAARRSRRGDRPLDD